MLSITDRECWILSEAIMRHTGAGLEERNLTEVRVEKSHLHAHTHTPGTHNGFYPVFIHEVLFSAAATSVTAMSQCPLMSYPLS